MLDVVSQRTILLTFLLAFAVSNPIQAATLDRQLLKHAPDVLKYCRTQGYDNVGVLKFRVQKGQSALTDNVGPLNLDMATQLELALVLANRVQNPVGIIRDASAVAATIPGANHVVAEGRPPLFSRRYPLAWGNEPVTADAFLTGVVHVSEDLQQLAVGIVAFGRDSAMDDGPHSRWPQPGCVPRRLLARRSLDRFGQLRPHRWDLESRDRRVAKDARGSAR